MATERLRRAPASRRAPSIVLGVALLLAVTLAAADSMRCGNRVIVDDDTIEDVLEACGQPTTRSRTWIQRRPQYELGGQEYSFPGREDVPVDLWIYEGGPYKVTRRVRFIDGRVTSIETLGR